MWAATLIDGTVVDGRKKGVNFLHIPSPIQKLAIPGANIEVSKCSEYYMVFHAIAAFGQQGQVQAIEVGGLFADGTYHGFNLLKSGKVENKVYTKEEFPYKAALKSGQV